MLGETSFSPALGLTEKDTLNSKKLRTENKNITSKPNYYNMRDYTNLHNCCKHAVVDKYAKYEVNLGIIALSDDLIIVQLKNKTNDECAFMKFYI